MEEDFPYFISAEEAIQYLNAVEVKSVAILAYVVRILSLGGYSNAAIRMALSIDKVYRVTHLKRVGTLLSIDELMLWHKNPHRITFGHLRAIAQLPRIKRESLIRDLLIKKYSVREFEAIAQDRVANSSLDLKRFQIEVSEKMGRPVTIVYNQIKQSGVISLNFYGLDDLDTILNAHHVSLEDSD